MQFNFDLGEDDLEEWLGELNELFCRIRKISGTPGTDSLWLTTQLGDVHVFDAADLQVNFLWFASCFPEFVFLVFSHKFFSYFSYLYFLLCFEMLVFSTIFGFIFYF